MMCGILKEYYENGSLRREGLFENDEPSGPMRYYYENGGIKGEMLIEIQKDKCTIKIYNQNGDIIMDVLFNDDGLQSATCANGKQLTNAHVIRMTNAEDFADEALKIYNET